MPPSGTPTAPGAAVGVLIVDDSEPFLRAARRHLEFEPDLQVLGTARDGAQAIEMAGSLKPDVVLVDLSMPGMNGLETAAELKKLDPALLVVLLTGHDPEAYRDAAQQAGVDAMLGKWSLAEDAPPLIRRLCTGNAPAEDSRS